MPPFDSGREMGSNETLKAAARLVLRVLPPVIAVFMVVAGYYFIWSVSPESPFTEVMERTRAGIVLTVTGGLVLIVCMHGILR
ncbi:MAG: hypothetical protein HY889_07015 [Deltaproteobacteria bacterium]|nr:hypothetical protein [Deltaproteobacteria bacterium]